MAINIYFGRPGMGKTTLAAYICRKEGKKRPVYANFQLHGATFISAQDVGKLPPEEGAVLIIDEAGIEYNSRQIKSFTMDLIQYYKLHRHLKHDVYIFSQSYADMDITLRRIANRYWILKAVGPWIRMRQIRPMLTFDENNHDIVDGFELSPWFTGQLVSLATLRRIEPPARWVYMPPLFWMFDSWEHPYTAFKGRDPIQFVNPLRGKGIKRKALYWVRTRKRLLILMGVMATLVLMYRLIMSFG